MFKISKITAEEFEQKENDAINYVNMNFSGFSKGFRIHRGANWFKAIYFENYSDDLESIRFILHLNLIGRFFKFKKKSYFLMAITYPLEFWICSLAFLALSVVPLHDFQLQSIIVWFAFNLLIAFLARKEYRQLVKLAKELLQEEIE